MGSPRPRATTSSPPERNSWKLFHKSRWEGHDSAVPTNLIGVKPSYGVTVSWNACDWLNVPDVAVTVIE